MDSNFELGKYLRVELKKIQDKHAKSGTVLDHNTEQLIVKTIHIVEGTMQIPAIEESEK